MLSGLQNLTLKTLTRLEIALGEDIIITPRKAQEQTSRVKQARVISIQSQILDQKPNSFYTPRVKESLGMTAYRIGSKGKIIPNTLTSIKPLAKQAI